MRVLGVVCVLLLGCANAEPELGATSAASESENQSFACPSGQVACGIGYCIPSNAMCCTGRAGRYCSAGVCSNDGLFCTQPALPGLAPPCSGSTHRCTTTQDANGTCCGSSSVCCGTASAGCCSTSCVPVGSTTMCAFGASQMGTADPGGGGGGDGGTCAAGKQACGNSCITAGTTCCNNGTVSFGCPLGATCQFSGGTGPGGLGCLGAGGASGGGTEGPPLRCSASQGAPGLMIVLFAMLMVLCRRRR